MIAASQMAEDFEQAFACPPQGIAFAPGRVNLIGDHVDYNEGLVLPMPLALGTSVAWRRRSDGQVRARAANTGDVVHCFAPGDPPAQGAGWRPLVQGMIALMHREFPIKGGVDLLIRGDLPRGAGLSSSASLCIAIGHAVANAAERRSASLARIAQQVEHRFAGVECGIMDQMAIAAGIPGTAMLLDCRSLEHRSIVIPDGWSILVLQSGVTRELVDGEYNARREACESAARKLGVQSLREVGVDAADHPSLDKVESRRVRHVVSEIARTRAAAQATESGNLAEFGSLLRASHASLRDDFEVSHHEVDRRVDRLNEMIGPDGGARMTGGGFGGAIVVVCRTGKADEIEREDLADADHARSHEQSIRAYN